MGFASSAMCSEAQVLAKRMTGWLRLTQFDSGWLRLTQVDSGWQCSGPKVHTFEHQCPGLQQIWAVETILLGVLNHTRFIEAIGYLENMPTFFVDLLCQCNCVMVGSSCRQVNCAQRQPCELGTKSWLSPLTTLRNESSRGADALLGCSVLECKHGDRISGLKAIVMRFPIIASNGNCQPPETAGLFCWENTKSAGTNQWPRSTNDPKVTPLVRILFLFGDSIASTLYD